MVIMQLSVPLVTMMVVPVPALHIYFIKTKVVLIIGASKIKLQL